MVVLLIFFMFTPKIGEDEPILTSIFFRWVGEKPPTSNGRVVVNPPNLQDSLRKAKEAERPALQCAAAGTLGENLWMWKIQVFFCR